MPNEEYYENFDFATGEVVVACSACHEEREDCMCLFDRDWDEDDSNYLW